jgi:hypothetical protein
LLFDALTTRIEKLSYFHKMHLVLREAARSGMVRPLTGFPLVAQPPSPELGGGRTGGRDNPDKGRFRKN